MKHNRMGEMKTGMAEAATRTKWSLTREAFDKLMLCLDSDREVAGEKFLQIRRNLVRYFEGRGCALAEDHADETTNRVAKRVYEGEAIQDINSYFFGAARMVLLEVLKEREREQKAFNELPQFELVQPDIEEVEETEQKISCLNKCLQTLPLESRELITQYYQGERRDKIENRQRLANGLGIPLQALRSRAVRLREKLETCILSCLRKKQTGAT